MLTNDLFIKVILLIIGIIGTAMVQQLFAISKTLNEIKTSFEVLNTKHDYLTERVVKLENLNVKNSDHRI